jgi:hypothetical protein
MIYRHLKTNQGTLMFGKTSRIRPRPTRQNSVPPPCAVVRLDVVIYQCTIFAFPLFRLSQSVSFATLSKFPHTISDHHRYGLHQGELTVPFSAFIFNPSAARFLFTNAIPARPLKLLQSLISRRCALQGPYSGTLCSILLNLNSNNVLRTTRHFGVNPALRNLRRIFLF